MKLSITTIEKTVFNSDKVDKVILNSSEGQLTILPDHVSLITALSLGEITIVESGTLITSIFADGGIIKVQNNYIEILAEMAEHASELVEAKIEEAIRRAQKLIDEKPVNIDIAMVEITLRRELEKSKFLKKSSLRS